MGVNSYLVCDDAKAALDVGKWYALSPEDYGNVVESDLEAARTCDKVGDDVATWLADLGIRWLREVAKGRRVRKVSDSWQEDAFPWQRPWGTPDDGAWRAWTLFNPWGHGESERPWPPG